MQLLQHVVGACDDGRFVSATVGAGTDRPEALRPASGCLGQLVQACVVGRPSSKTVYIGWDGRIDNRAELLASLELPSGLSDADLIAAAYLGGSRAGLCGVIGDFAVAIWDAARLELCLARDPFGTRPLYYAIRNGLVWWSSRASALVAAVGDSLALEPDYVAGFLTATEDVATTPYERTRSVAPGTAAVFGREGTRIEPLWRPDPNRRTRHTCDADYEQEFRQLFLGAVRDRLAEPQTYVELSGGIDSSSIVCAASTLRDVSAPASNVIVPITYLYPGAPTSRETKYRAAVEAHTGLTSIGIEEPDAIRPLFDSSPPELPNPLWMFDGMYQALGRLMRSSGARTVMSGHGGDHMMLNAAKRAPALADAFRRGIWWQLFRDLHGYHHQWKRAYGELLWTSVVWPLLPARLRGAFGGRRTAVPPLFNRSFAKRGGVSERWIGAHGDGGYRTCAGEWQYGLLREAVSVSAACYYRERIDRDVAYPYLDRRLVEFLLSIPAEQKMNPTEMRSVQRRALEGIVPSVVRLRASKSGIGEVTCRAIAREWPRVKMMMSNSRLVSGGFLDRRAVDLELQRARHGVCEYVQPLSRALVLEAWLQSKDA